MKILLRHIGTIRHVGTIGQDKETVHLSRVPNEGEEIHWADRILRIDKTMHFPMPAPAPDGPTDIPNASPTEDEFHGYVACCYVIEHP